MCTDRCRQVGGLRAASEHWFTNRRRWAHRAHCHDEAQFYALYKYTKDPHYLDVARLLLNDTKSMVALPGRLYDMRGPGWQPENFSMGPSLRGRGVGSHRHWLPWVSANHLHGITAMEELDPALFKQMSTKPAGTGKSAK